MKEFSTNINGYIEGYYGRLLNWIERNQILRKLNCCNFNTYFYCPKEDLSQRLNWRKNYNRNWITAFENFCKNSQRLKIGILVGISPGLDFNFGKSSDDFNILVNKAKLLKCCGAKYVSLLFDDIPRRSFRIDEKKSEGVLHAELANDLSKELNEKIFVVPRVYSDELIDIEYSYLADFNKTLNDHTPIFYCGQKIISETNKSIELETIKKTTSNKIIFWDNLYANDYCPKRIFIGPYFGRSDFNNTMINPTGLIKTDLFILDLIYFTKLNNDIESAWIRNQKKYKIPEQFNIISRYFFPINFNQEDGKHNYSYNEEIEALDFLLWKWKSPLSREWYQYMLNLKQDLQLVNGNLDINRIKKIFPVTLTELLLKFKWGDK